MTNPKHYSPSFGAWLERMRGASSLREFARQVGVDQGTISRTERECTEVSVLSVVRICQGLGLSLSDLFAQWLGRTLPRPVPSQQQYQGVLTGQDVQRWLMRILEGHRRSRELLIAALNVIVLRSGLLATSLPPLSQLFSLADIEKMLWDLPWFHLEVTPPHHEPFVASLPAISGQEGLILPAEIGAYIRLARSQRNLSPQELSQLSQVSPGRLASLENGRYERLGLYELLRLDDCLQHGGELVELYWGEISGRLCLEQTWNALPGTAVCSTGAKHALVSLLISVGHWLQYIHQNDDDAIWLATIRHGISLAGPQTMKAGAQ